MKYLLLFIAFITLTSCAYHEYDSKNPDEYIKFWCNPANYDGTLQEISMKRAGMDKNADECKRVNKRD